MIIDAALLLAKEQAVTAAAASENYIDQGAKRDLGIGEGLFVVAVVTTAFTDADSDSTVTVALQADDNTSFSSVKSQAVGTFAKLSPVGSRLVARINPGSVDERYLRGYFTPVDGSLTTGAISMFITKDVDFIKSYPDNRTITG